MTTVGVLGGTGPAGRGVAIRLASAGYDVILGSRDETRAGVTASTLLARGEGVIRGGTNQAAADCEFVVVATPWDSAVHDGARVARLAQGQSRHLDGERPRP